MHDARSESLQLVKNFVEVVYIRMLNIKLFIIEQDGFTGMEKLTDKLLTVLQNLQKENEEERVTVDLRCHLGHAYITEVDKGE